MSEENIEQLMEITGLDRQTADTILKINDNNLQQAINYHLEAYGDNEPDEVLPLETYTESISSNRHRLSNNLHSVTTVNNLNSELLDGTRYGTNTIPSTVDIPGASSVSENASLPDFLSTDVDRTSSSNLDYNGGGGGGDDDDIRAPIPSRREQLVLPEDDQFRFQHNGIRKRRAQPTTFTVCPFRNFAREAEQQEAQFHNETDPVNDVEPQFLAMPDFGNQYDRNALASARAIRAKRKRLEDLFRPPSELLFWGTFQGARDHATSLNRWLVVNVQDHREFKSQILNRDVWSNNDLKEMILKYFVMWQISVDSIEGMRFKTFYRVVNMPYVCLIDPRTGEDKKTFDTDTATSLLSQLSKFLNDNSFGLDASRPPFDELVSTDIISSRPSTSSQLTPNTSVSSLDSQYDIVSGNASSTSSISATLSSFRSAIKKFDNIQLNNGSGSSNSNTTPKKSSDNNTQISTQSIRKNCSDPFPPLLELSEQDQLNLAIQNSLKEKYSKDNKSLDDDDTSDTNSNSDYNLDTDGLNSNELLIGPDLIGINMVRENNLVVCDDNATSYFEQVMKKVAKDKTKSPQDKKFFQQNDQMNKQKKQNSNLYQDFLGDRKDPTTKIQIRLPLGERENLEWPSSTILRAIKLYINAKYPEFGNDSYKLISPYPRQNILELDDQITLVAANLHPTAILYLHQDD